MTQPPASDPHAIAADFMVWVVTARRLIDDHFPSERPEAHHQLIIDTARSMMLSSRLGAIETTLAGLIASLAQPEES